MQVNCYFWVIIMILPCFIFSIPEILFVFFLIFFPELVNVESEIDSEVLLMLFLILIRMWGLDSMLIGGWRLMKFEDEDWWNFEIQGWWLRVEEWSYNLGEAMCNERILWWLGLNDWVLIGEWWSRFIMESLAIGMCHDWSYLWEV